MTTLIQRVPLTAAALLLGVVLSTGCDNKEKVLDVETPNGELEIERDRDTGEVDIEAERE